MKRWSVGVALLIGWVTSGLAGEWAPSCLGPLCLNAKGMTEKKWVKRFGSGEVVKGPYSDTELAAGRCYFLDQSNAWLMVRFDPQRLTEGRSTSLVELFMSDVAICGMTEVINGLQQPISTSKGIHLGLREDEVVKILGKATRVDLSSVQTGAKAWLNETIYGAKYGSRLLVYERGTDSNEVASYYFSDGRLRSILFSNSE